MILSKKIAAAIKYNWFISFIIIGDRNVGKSTYALKALKYAFMLLGYTEKESWIMALDCIKFTIPEVTEYLMDGVALYEDTHTKLPCLIWDDLRKYAGGINFFLDKRLYSEITGLLDTIKIPINVFIGTCPSMKGVMGVLQDYDTYQINIIHNARGRDYRTAKGFLWKTSPMGQRTLYPKFRDIFYCKLPNAIWTDYEQRRIEITKQSIRAVSEASSKKK